MDHPGLIILACICIALQALNFLGLLFGPDLAYRMARRPPQEVDSTQFSDVLEAVTDSKQRAFASADLFANGDNFYPAELEAVRAAQHHVHLEAYIFQRGKVADEFLAALTERARAGVEVRLVIDALGSFTTRKKYFKPLIQAGGRICFYHPLRWDTLLRMNHRTHREMLIVDGKVAFIGGAGVADHWRDSRPRHPQWRDSVLRVTGSIVASLQATFAENWLESSGEVLVSAEYFPQAGPGSEDGAMLVVNSTPSIGTSTRARTLFQLLLSSAQQSIHINSPYFLPDEAARRALAAAVARGVDVRVIVPGKKSDHAFTRSSSRRMYGKLLQCGLRIFEYQPSMIHAKIMIIDGKWCVMGSTNFDHRSFGLNDEVNLAAHSPQLAEALAADFRLDLARSQEVTYEQWRRRPVTERFTEALGFLIQRQE